jgi:hypothetical protein
MLAFLFLAFPFLSFPPQCRNKSPWRWDYEGSRGGRSEVVSKRRRRRRGRGEQGRRERSEGSLERASRPQPQEPIQKAKKTLEGKQNLEQKQEQKLGTSHSVVAATIARCLVWSTPAPSLLRRNDPAERAPPPPPNSAAERSLIVPTLLGTPSNCLPAPQNALQLSAHTTSVVRLFDSFSNDHRFRFLKFPRTKEPPVQSGGYRLRENSESKNHPIRVFQKQPRTDSFQERTSPVTQTGF